MPKAISHFWWLPTSLSIVLSALGIIALARHAFVTWSLSGPLELVMAAYNATMQLLFGWAQPYLQAALTWLGSFVGWRPTLYPHWRDVFVVLSLVGISAGRVLLWDGKLVIEEITNVITIVIRTILCASITALAAGVLPLQSPDLITQLLIAASLGLGVLPLIVEVLFTDLEPDDQMLLVLLVLLGSLVFALGTSALSVLITWLLALALGSAVGLGLAGLACMVALFGVILIGIDTDLRSSGHFAEINLFWGLNILGGFVGAAFVFAVDAGLKLLGA